MNVRMQSKQQWATKHEAGTAELDYDYGDIAAANESVEKAKSILQVFAAATGVQMLAFSQGAAPSAPAQPCQEEAELQGQVQLCKLCAKLCKIQ